MSLRSVNYNPDCFFQESVLIVLDKSTVTFLKIHNPKTLGSKQAFSMLASKMAAALLVLANWKSGMVKLAGSLDLFPPVSPVNLFTSVK